MRHEFVEFMPDQLENGVLYISISYNTATHLCACDCGREVITPFTPVDWSMTYNGRTVSLKPSIGNWNFPCKSHYFITDGEVRWAKTYTEEEMQTVREHDISTAIIYGQRGILSSAFTQEQKTSETQKASKGSFFEKIGHSWILVINSITRKR